MARAIMHAGEDAVGVARGLRRLQGVLSVTADPVRRQVVVHYAPERVSRERLRAHVRPGPAEAHAWTRFLSWWPLLSRVPSLLLVLI